MTDDDLEDDGPALPDRFTLGELVLSGASDLASLASWVVPTETLSQLLGHFRHRKIEEGRALLFEKLRKGEISDFQATLDDELLGVINRYDLAAAMGRARRNMHLLAQAIVGLAKRDRLFADDFHAYAKSLEDLTRDEILVLGRFYAFLTEERQRGDADTERQRLDAWRGLTAELVPSTFTSEDHIIALLGGLTRSGLMVAVTTFGTINYRPSPQMEELAETVDFEEALAEERAKAE